MSDKKLTLAIVTRKRPEKLQRCLESVQKQTVLPERVIIVDNDPSQSAEKTSFFFKKSLPLVYVAETKPGIPPPRNKALEMCTTDLLGFVDDDCVLNKNWVEVGKKAIPENKIKTAWVIGKSLLLNKGSIVAQTQFHINSYWFQHKIDKKTKKLNPQSLDTKNVILKVNLLKRHNTRFDNRFATPPFDGWEDTDLGLQLNSHGFKGYYEPKMVVFHEEVDQLPTFFKKAYHRGKTVILLYDKWKLHQELVGLSNRKIYKWIFFSLKKLPQEYREIQKEGTLSKLAILLLKRLFERTLLQGFVDQKNSQSGVENF